MTEQSIQEYINTYTAYRDNGEIVEEIIKPGKITLTLRDGRDVDFPKHVEIHRFIITGRRGTHSYSHQVYGGDSRDKTITFDKLKLSS